MSVQTGINNLIGAAQIQRVNDPNGDHGVPGSHHAYEDIFKGIHDDENNVYL